jgi:hypothetical protein
MLGTLTPLALGFGYHHCQVVVTGANIPDGVRTYERVAEYIVANTREECETVCWINWIS